MVDPAIQQRIEIDANLVGDYAETIANWQSTSPLTVYRDQDGVCWLADGFHRHAAATKAGLDCVTVEVRQGDKRDAIRHSLSANARHGARRGAADLLKAYQTAVAMQFCAPDDARVVAELLCCSERHARDLTATARNQAKERQRETILNLVSTGLSQREVANQLGISVGLVNATVQKRNTAKTERIVADIAPTSAKSDAGAADPQRDHLSDWQRGLLRRLDGQAMLNGRAPVAAALQSWLAEVAP
ncbi:ParB-like nuclease domain protein [Thiorhodovibrio winogradskyi]|uniref:ParB-like nuclease domain protein n=1 Tax=Thiorhodovibrio winogradskyi TaxID=77007 RepID=A0ABZ0S317_9GAMM|nr:ParB N-terminal domain-containing protein [Thiorhodovibrio winogradskyi]